MELGWYWVFLSPQRYKRWVRNRFDITSFDCFSVDKPKEADFFQFLIRQFWGWVNIQQPEVINWFVAIVYWIFLPLSLKSMRGCIITKITLLLEYFVIIDLFCIAPRVIFIGFIWYNLQLNIIFLTSWLNYIK